MKVEKFKTGCPHTKRGWRVVKGSVVETQLHEEPVKYGRKQIVEVRALDGKAIIEVYAVKLDEQRNGPPTLLDDNSFYEIDEDGNYRRMAGCHMPYWKEIQGENFFLYKAPTIQ